MQTEIGDKKEAVERVERAGRLLLTRGWNRPILNSKAGLVLLKRTKYFSYRFGFNSVSNRGVKLFLSLYNKDWSSFFIQNE